MAKLLEPNHTVLTFNWDTLFDDTQKRLELLQDRENWKKYANQYCNFLHHLSPFKEDTYTHISISPPYSDYSPSIGYYIKLHGSVDWLYCDNRNCRAWAKPFPTIKYTDNNYCSECHDRVYPLIMPPVLYKQYTKYPLLTVLWNTASKEIWSADEVIIWGYSLPPTDFYTNWLFRQADYTLKKVSIINPNTVRAGIMPKWNYSFLRNIYGPFRHKVKQNQLHVYEHFEDYISNAEAQTKYKLGTLERL